LVGESLDVPNLFPYDCYSAVTILSDADSVTLTSLSEDLLAGAFSADVAHLRRVRDTGDQDLQHYSVNWNYMPLAGGSVVHTHHQPVASPMSTNYHREVEAGLYQYGGDYFGNLVRQVEEGGERRVGREGGVSWLTGFATLGHIAMVGVLEGRASLFDLTDEDVGALAWSLLKIFDHLYDEHFVSFNFSPYVLEGAEGFTLNCRLSPRFPLSNASEASDVNYFEVSNAKSLAFFYREATARELREQFAGPEGESSR
jgi:UDPglucose--hexose-1-phosphate uridylyltransferase